MAKSLRDWVETDVKPVKDRPLKWISEQYFFRDPSRPTYSDDSFFFSPADGIILYQVVVGPTDPILEIKGKAYSLRAALQDESFGETCLVIGIFMTMYDVHVNRVPYGGFLSYRLLDPIRSMNMPMLAEEHSLIEDLVIDHDKADYLHDNQRLLNRIYAPALGQNYYVLQIADYDVNCVTPFNLGQRVPVTQNERFSQIRFGSQVDLIIPRSPRFNFEPVQQTGMHVEAGVDPLVAVTPSAGALQS